MKRTRRSHAGVLIVVLVQASSLLARLVYEINWNTSGSIWQCSAFCTVERTLLHWIAGPFTIRVTAHYSLVTTFFCQSASRRLFLRLAGFKRCDLDLHTSFLSFFIWLGSLTQNSLFVFSRNCQNGGKSLRDLQRGESQDPQCWSHASCLRPMMCMILTDNSSTDPQTLPDFGTKDS